MDEYVESIKYDLEASRKFFGNKYKQKRELWVLREFLSYFPHVFNQLEVIGSNQEPNDGFYKHHGFQIKEVLSEGRKRGKEYKEKLNSITDQTGPEDFLEPYIHMHIPLIKSLPYVKLELARHREDKYNNETADINVLVYLNLSDTTYTNDTPEYSNSEFSLWKSVSLVSNNNAIVLTCNDEKDELLYPRVGQLHVKN